MTDRELRTALDVLADEVAVVDLTPGVHARARVLRRRRRVVAATAPVAALLAAAAFLASPPEPEAAPPAERHGPPVVDLAAAPLGGLAGSAFAVVDTDSGSAWVLTESGRAARLATPVRSLPGAVPTLSAGGSVLSFGGTTTVTLVRTSDGAADQIPTTDGQHHQVSVSPDGGTVAYAADDQVDSIDLTLVRPDGSDSHTLTVTTTAASGALVPTVWGDDGTSVLVLDGAGATRVDLLPEPTARRGAHVAGNLVLAHGWAAAPDLSRFVMSDTGQTGDGRRWELLSSTDGRRTGVLTRPADDRLMGWSADDRLHWWHRTSTGYAVVSTDLAGRSPRIEMRVTSDRPHLEATWVEDAG